MGEWLFVFVREQHIWWYWYMQAKAYSELMSPNPNAGKEHRSYCHAKKALLRSDQLYSVTRSVSSNNI